MSKRIGIASCVAGLVVVAFASCGDDGGGGGEQVEARLSEFLVDFPGGNEIDAGTVTLEADNIGSETHEFVVVRADSAESLPTDADGAVNEDEVPAADQLGEVEDIAAEDQGSLEVDLDPGNYVVFCNIVEEEGGVTVSHFAEGMHNVLIAE
jgi:hypothetical protein